MSRLLTCFTDSFNTTFPKRLAWIAVKSPDSPAQPVEAKGEKGKEGTEKKEVDAEKVKKIEALKVVAKDSVASFKASIAEMQKQKPAYAKDYENFGKRIGEMEATLQQQGEITETQLQDITSKLSAIIGERSVMQEKISSLDQKNIDFGKAIQARADLKPVFDQKGETSIQGIDNAVLARPSTMEPGRWNALVNQVFSDLNGKAVVGFDKQKMDFKSSGDLAADISGVENAIKNTGNLQSAEAGFSSFQDQLATDLSAKKHEALGMAYDLVNTLELSGVGSAPFSKETINKDVEQERASLTARLASLTERYSQAAENTAFMAQFNQLSDKSPGTPFGKTLDTFSALNKQLTPEKFAEAAAQARTMEDLSKGVQDVKAGLTDMVNKGGEAIDGAKEAVANFFGLGDKPADQPQVAANGEITFPDQIIKGPGFTGSVDKGLKLTDNKPRLVDLPGLKGAEKGQTAEVTRADETKVIATFDGKDYVGKDGKHLSIAKGDTVVKGKVVTEAGASFDRIIGRMDAQPKRPPEAAKAEPAESQSNIRYSFDQKVNEFAKAVNAAESASAPEVKQGNVDRAAKLWSELNTVLQKLDVQPDPVAAVNASPMGNARTFQTFNALWKARGADLARRMNADQKNEAPTKGEEPPEKSLDKAGAEKLFNAAVNFWAERIQNDPDGGRTAFEAYVSSAKPAGFEQALKLLEKGPAALRDAVRTRTIQLAAAARKEAGPETAKN